MDVSNYKEKYGEPKTLEEILNYCAFLRGVRCLEHRTLREFDWFVSSLIFGKTEYKYTMTNLKSKDPKSLEYKLTKRTAKDALKIYEKYNHIYNPCGQDSLLKYARAFLKYCEKEYGYNDHG